MFVYVKKEFIRSNDIMIKNVDFIKAGLIGIGNKGAIEMNIQINDKLIHFTNCHLSAGQDMYQIV